MADSDSTLVFDHGDVHLEVIAPTEIPIIYPTTAKKAKSVDVVYKKGSSLKMVNLLDGFKQLRKLGAIDTIISQHPHQSTMEGIKQLGNCIGDEQNELFLKNAHDAAKKMHKRKKMALRGFVREIEEKYKYNMPTAVRCLVLSFYTNSKQLMHTALFVCERYIISISEYF